MPFWGFFRGGADLELDHRVRLALHERRNLQNKDQLKIKFARALLDLVNAYFEIRCNADWEFLEQLDRKHLMRLKRLQELAVNSMHFISDTDLAALG